MKKIIWFIVIAIAAAVLVFLVLREGQPSEPELGEDTTAQINKSLEGIELNGIDEMFGEIDSELNKL